MHCAVGGTPNGSSSRQRPQRRVSLPTQAWHVHCTNFRRLAEMLSLQLVEAKENPQGYLLMYVMGTKVTFKRIWKGRHGIPARRIHLFIDLHG